MKSSQHTFRPSLFAPLLTSQAGTCLTMRNWQDIGVQAGIYSLEALIVKPGIETLKSFRDLRQYTGWFGSIILYVGITPKATTGEYVIRSPFDGGIITLTSTALLALIHHLQPDEIIGFEGDREAARERVVASDKPAADALLGLIYEQATATNECGQLYSLLESRYAQDFLPLSPDCNCPTCADGMTRAYLHHLLQHTPLLAQRFLVTHNVYLFSHHSLNEQAFVETPGKEKR